MDLQRLGNNCATLSAGDGDNQEAPQEIVHKLQKAKAIMSAQANARNNESHEVIEAREQRSQIAIIQMAPPATQNSASSNNVTTLKSSSSVPAAALNPSATQVTQVAGVNGTRKPENASSKKKRHHCTVHGCTYTTPHTKDLARHMRKHTGEKPFNCDRCTKSFTRYDKLVMHIRTHEGYRPFPCPVCSHAASDSSSLKKHLRTHNNERPYKCQLCPYASKDSSQLVVHLRHHTGDSPYTCAFAGCDAAFKTPSDLSRHTRLHTGEKPYKCSFCAYRAAVKCNLNAHMRRHAKPAQKRGKGKTIGPGLPSEEEEAEDTDIDVVTTNGFQQSSTSDELPFQYACKLCKFKADSIDHFCIHMKEAHPNSPSTSRNNQTGKPKSQMIIGSNVRNFECTKCNVAFVCKESLRCHMRQHGTVPNKPANVAPEIYTPAPPARTLTGRTTNNNNARRVETIRLHGDNNHLIVNNDGNSDYTLHEMQRVPLVHSVITENPAVMSNSTHHQTQFDEASTNRMYVVSYNENGSIQVTENPPQRTHPNMYHHHHHQFHDAAAE